MVDNRTYTLKTDFDEFPETEDWEQKKDELFHKKLELLCLEYNVNIDWDYR